MTPSFRVGLTITETFVTSTDDTSLLDNAQVHQMKTQLVLIDLK